MRAVVVILVLAFMSAERWLGRVMFSDETAIKDWRRRRHPANSRRSWTLFGVWTFDNYGAEYDR